MNRCRNCGLPDHQTQVCPRYGPWYPEPGKNREDYAALAAKITKMVARDILSEHEAHEDEEADAPPDYRRAYWKMTELEKQAQTFTCPLCYVKPGDPCISNSGKRAKQSHQARRNLVAA